MNCWRFNRNADFDKDSSCFDLSFFIVLFAGDYGDDQLCTYNLLFVSVQTAKNLQMFLNFAAEESKNDK